MVYTRTIYRDRLALDSEFANRLDRANLQLGSTILLSARDLQVNGAFSLTGYHLVLLADRFDGSTGHILVDNRQGNGPDVTVICREFLGASLTSQGGKGRAGKRGQRGREGMAGFCADAVPPGRGGRGGPGGSGGAGGRGGSITLSYVADISDEAPAPVEMASIGGPGGPGGQGGEGGPGGRPDPRCGQRWGDPGQPGAKGPNGPMGKPGPCNTNQVSLDEYWQETRSRAADWAKYRLRTAEYYYRAFSTAEQRSGYRRIALQEIEAVLALDPDNRQAGLYKKQLLNNQVFLGFARDIDLIPDFEQYEEVITDYGDMVLSLFQTANDLFLADIPLEHKKRELETRIQHFQVQVETILPSEVKAARTDGTAAERVSEHAANRVKDILKRIRECEEDQIDFFDIAIPIVAIVGAVASIASGGVSLVAALPTIAAVGSNILTGDISLLDLNEKEKKRVKEAAGGLKELANAAKGLIDLHKAAKEISDAVSDSPCKTLAQQAVELAHAKLLAELRVEQTDALLVAAELRLNLAKKDLQAATEHYDVLGEDIAQLAQAANTLVKISQAYMDVLMKYAFQAARAVEIYTLVDLSDQIRFDYGHIHPDQEADFAEGYSSIPDLMEAYQRSWSEFVEVIYFRNEYINYLTSGNRISDLISVSFDEDADRVAVNRFREDCEIQFTIDVASLPSSRYEAKVESVSVTLRGVRADSQHISCFVEHSGLFESKRRDGQTVTMALEPRPTVVVVEGQPHQYGEYGGTIEADEPLDLGFWGRGLAATWHVFIEKEEIERRNVDLTRLSGIQVRIGYACFVERHS